MIDPKQIIIYGKKIKLKMNDPSIANKSKDYIHFLFFPEIILSPENRGHKLFLDIQKRIRKCFFNKILKSYVC